MAIAGQRYTLAASDFPQTAAILAHQMHTLNLKSRSRGVFDWALAASLYDHGRDRQRAYAPTNAAQPQAGRITDLAGTGWQTLAAKGVWRPAGEAGAHTVDAGLSQDTSANTSAPTCGCAGSSTANGARRWASTT